MKTKTYTLRGFINRLEHLSNDNLPVYMHDIENDEDYGFDVSAFITKFNDDDEMFDFIVIKPN